MENYYRKRIKPLLFSGKLLPDQAISSSSYETDFPHAKLKVILTPGPGGNIPAGEKGKLIVRHIIENSRWEVRIEEWEDNDGKLDPQLIETEHQVFVLDPQGLSDLKEELNSKIPSSIGEPEILSLLRDVAALRIRVENKHNPAQNFETKLMQGFSMSRNRSNQFHRLELMVQANLLRVLAA